MRLYNLRIIPSILSIAQVVALCFDFPFKNILEECIHSFFNTLCLWFESQLHHILTVTTCPSYLAALCLSFLIYKTMMTTVPTSYIISRVLRKYLTHGNHCVSVNYYFFFILYKLLSLLITLINPNHSPRQHSNAWSSIKPFLISPFAFTFPSQNPRNIYNFLHSIHLVNTSVLSCLFIIWFCNTQ